MTHLDPKAAQLEDGAAELSSIIVDVRAGRFTNHAALADRLVAIVDRNRAALAALPQAEPVGWQWRMRSRQAPSSEWNDWCEWRDGHHNMSNPQTQFAEYEERPVFASPTPAVSREDVIEECAKVCDGLAAAARVEKAREKDSRNPSIIFHVNDMAEKAFGKAGASIRALSQPHSEK